MIHAIIIGYSRSVTKNLTVRHPSQTKCLCRLENQLSGTEGQWLETILCSHDVKRLFAIMILVRQTVQNAMYSSETIVTTVLIPVFPSRLVYIIC